MAGKRGIYTLVETEVPEKTKAGRPVSSKNSDEGFNLELLNEVPWAGRGKYERALKKFMESGKPCAKVPLNGRSIVSLQANFRTFIRRHPEYKGIKVSRYQDNLYLTKEVK